MLVLSSNQSSLSSSSTRVGLNWDVCGCICFLWALLVGVLFSVVVHMC